MTGVGRRSGPYVDLVMRHQSLARQAAAIAAETEAINRRLHEMLSAYLTRHVPQCAGDSSWRWEITAADERGVLFICRSFYHGFDTPDRPREVLVPMEWVWWQQPGSGDAPVEPTGSPAHLRAGAHQ